LDDVCKLALKVEKRKKEKKVFYKPSTKDLTSSRPQYKPFSTPKPESSSKLDKGKAVALPSPNEFPKRLRVRSVLNVKVMVISNIIAQIKEL